MKDRKKSVLLLDQNTMVYVFSKIANKLSFSSWSITASVSEKVDKRVCVARSEIKDVLRTLRVLHREEV